MTALPDHLYTWLSRKIGAPPTAEALRAYQLAKLNDTLERAQRHSPFYRKLYASFAGRERLSPTAGGPIRLSRTEELPLLPTFDARALAAHGAELLCLPQQAIARIVTLQTGGTSGEPKRLFFSDADLRATEDFFQHGLADLMGPSGKALILFPCERPGGVGDLLLRALGSRAAPGPVSGSLREAARQIGDLHAGFLIGHAVPILAIGRYAYANGLTLPKLSGMLVSGDRAVPSLLSALEEVWQCPVYEHYGLTESGYGAAVACPRRSGLHLREADLLLEIIDPQSGQEAPPHGRGELVLTTLTREAMPLIRYRTGDAGAWLPGDCACGLPLRRLGPDIARIAAEPHEAGARADLQALDGALFPLPQVADLGVDYRGGAGGRLTVWAVAPLAEGEVLRALADGGIPAVLNPEIRAAEALPGMRKRAAVYA